MIKDLYNYQSAQRQNEIIIKAFDLNDDEIQDLRWSLCSYGRKIFASPIHYKKKLEALFDEIWEDFLLSQMEKHRYNNVGKFYQYILNRAEKINNGEKLDHNPNQLIINFNPSLHRD